MGCLPDDLEERIGSERFEAWMAIARIERLVYNDRVSIMLDEVIVQKADIGNAVLAAIREQVRLGL